jgi:hypothetical protein
MPSTQPLSKDKPLVASVVLLVCAAAGLAGIEVSGPEQETLTQSVLQVLGGASVIFAAVRAKVLAKRNASN